MKKIFFLIFLLAMAVPSISQTLSEEDYALLRDITSKTNSIKSFTCSFTQQRQDPLLEEPSISKGQMQYRNDGTVVWKCISPESYQLTILKDRVIFASGGKNRTINMSSGKMTGSLQKLVDDISSGSAFAQPDNFKVSVIRGKSSVSVRLEPVKKILQKHISSVTMRFFSDNLLIDNFMYSTPEGGSTTISFSDWKIEWND